MAQATLARAAASATRLASSVFILSFGQTAKRNRQATAPIAASSMTPAQPALSADMMARPADASARQKKPIAAQRQAPAGTPKLVLESPRTEKFDVIRV